MQDIVTIIAQASMKATVLHMHNEAKFKALNDCALSNELVCEELRKVLRRELPNFISKDLKEANDSALSEAWIREMINAQCNLWAIEALNQAQERV
jgi:hypothetical protein